MVGKVLLQGKTTYYVSLVFHANRTKHDSESRVLLQVGTFAIIPVAVGYQVEYQMNTVA